MRGVDKCFMLARGFVDLIFIPLIPFIPLALLINNKMSLHSSHILLLWPRCRCMFDNTRYLAAIAAAAAAAAAAR